MAEEMEVGSQPAMELVEVSLSSPSRGHALPTRPSVRLGRELSIKRKRQTAKKTTDADGRERDDPFQREAVRYRSLQLRPRKSESSQRVRRANSLTGVNRYDQWQELTVNFRGDLRQSSRRLEDRIAQHHRTVAHRPQYTRRNVWQLFLNVHWPKVKSRLRVVFGYELWNGHLKEVEGHFGTGVVSYFIFLRWLFLLNLFIFLLWFGLAVIPQLVWVAGTNAPRTPSQLACVFPLNTSGPPQTCPDGGPPRESVIPGPPSAEVLQMYGARLLCRGGEVGGREGRFKVGECQFERENGTLVARREDPDGAVSDLATCFNLTSYEDVEFYYMCPRDIDPVTLWYQHIFDFALGRGIFNDTVLFHGRYTNETVSLVGRAQYNLPLAYFLLTGLVFLISVILLVYKMGQAYNESDLQLSRRQTTNYCNKLFSSWEFSVTDHSTARLRRAQIKRQIEEDIADLEKRSKKRDLREWALVILSRTLTNLFVLFILIGAGAAIFRAAQLGLSSQASGESLQLEGFLLPVVFTAFNISLPILFSFLARFERFKTQSGEIRMTLIRAILVRLSSLVVLFITLLILISCTQSFQGGGGGDVEEEDVEEGTCQFNVPDISIGSQNGTSEFETRENCPQCWETFVGQELYKLGLVNFVLSAITTLSVETARNLLSRLPYNLFSQRLGKGTFNIARSILDLIYTQALLWLGFFYSPFLPFVILLTSFMLFYVKKYSLMWNLEPSSRGAFKATRTNFLFLFLLLAVLLASVIPISYAIARLHPSETCGPFRGQELIYDVVTDLLEQADCRVQQVFDYVQSTGFLLPIIMVLLLLSYAQWVVLKARKHRFILLKKQLLLEAADSTFYGHELQKKAKEEEGVVREEGGVAPLQQRLSALQDMTEEERDKVLQEKRLSVQVSFLPHDLSHMTSS